MNVLEAIEALNKFESKISALERGIFKLELDKEHSYEARLLTEIKHDIENQAEKLRDRLEKSTLAAEVNVRGI